MGSVLIEWGKTKVLCSVSVEDKVPQWMNSEDRAWLTSEYNMLPGSSDKRISRERARSTGRTHEIQRLIGRSLRRSIELDQLGKRTFTVDCDVIQADGGTRVAAITGACLALRLSLERLKQKGNLTEMPPSLLVSAVSLGRVDGELVTDLNYKEDVNAELDANVVMNERNEFIEVQATAEQAAFTRAQWDELLDMAMKSCSELFEIQRSILKQWQV